MTWLKLGDEFSKECRRARLSDSAFRLHVEALCFAMDDENGGVIYEDDITAFARARNPFACAEELERVGFWERTSDTRWKIRNQMQHQPSTDVLAARRAAAAERQHRKRLKDAGLTPAATKVPSQRESRRDERSDTSRDDPRDPVRVGPVLVGSGSVHALEVSTNQTSQETDTSTTTSPASCEWCKGKGRSTGCPECRRRSGQ